MMVDAEGRLTPERKLDKQREVYFVRAIGLNLIKIGVANNAALRLRSLMSHSPVPLELLAIQPCTRSGATEVEHHRRFARQRRHGEWFEPSPDLMELIGMLAMAYPARIRRLREGMHKPVRHGPGRPTGTRTER